MRIRLVHSNIVSLIVLIASTDKYGLAFAPNSSFHLRRLSRPQEEQPWLLSPITSRSSKSRIAVVDDNQVGQISSTTASKSTDETTAASNFQIYEVSSSSFSEPTTAMQLTESKGEEVDFGSGLLWRGVVVILCGLWASNFAAAKLVMAEPGVDSSLYAVTRFSIAALSLLPFAVSSARKYGMDFETMKTSMICGAWVAFGYLGQLIGLLTTTASRSCVICSLHCVFVALVAELVRVSKSASSSSSFDTKRIIPAAVAVAGVAIVELWGAAGAPTIGDLLSFAQPIGFGMGYLQLEELMKRRPDLAMPVSAIKLGVVAFASLLYFELGPWILSDVANTAESWIRIPDLGAIFASPVAMGGILYTGLITTALALWVESVAFARVPATDASIILTTEPLFAAALGAVWLGETFGASDYVGASLIITACVLATLMDTKGDEKCVVEADPSCQPPRKWPFWGF